MKRKNYKLEQIALNLGVTWPPPKAKIPKEERKIHRNEQILASAFYGAGARAVGRFAANEIVLLLKRINTFKNVPANQKEQLLRSVELSLQETLEKIQEKLKEEEI